jgi:class 3 adenylate cyclase
MESLPANLAEKLRELTFNERAVAYLQIDAALVLVGAGGHLENYGLAAVRLGEPAVEQVFFLEGLLPLHETPFFVPSVELECGRAADLHFYLDADTVWVVLLDVTAYRDATRRLQQKAYEMTLLQEKEAQLNRRLEDANRELEAANDFLVTISTKLSHYLAPQIYKSIFSGQKDVTIHTERKELTIFFSDIKDFTATTEHLQPEAITQLLNEYFTEMAAIALGHGGTVDKFIGDALVIFFGDPETKGTMEDARACLTMATAMQRRLAELNVKWRSTGTEQPFRVRMGINTGFCNVGNFGSADRMDYTAIGAEVNLAARLQSIAEPGHIVISYETYALVRDIVAARALPQISVKGINRMVVPYVVEGVLDETGRKIEIFSEHMAGLDFYLDPRAVDAAAVERVQETLRNAIAALEARGREGSPAETARPEQSPSAPEPAIRPAHTFEAQK